VEARVEAPKNNKERKTMKKITISSKNITLKQWSNLVLELNLKRMVTGSKYSFSYIFSKNK
jgi:hypothetical protein